MASPISNFVVIDKIDLSQVGTAASTPSPVAHVFLVVISAARGASIASTIATSGGVIVASKDVALSFISATSGKDQSFGSNRTVDNPEFVPGAAWIQCHFLVAAPMLLVPSLRLPFELLLVRIDFLERAGSICLMVCSWHSSKCSQPGDGADCV